MNRRFHLHENFRLSYRLTFSAACLTRRNRPAKAKRTASCGIDRETEGCGSRRHTGGALTLVGLCGVSLLLLAVAAYAIWAVVMPYSWLRSIVIAALLFVTGRVLFARGYSTRPGRALGSVTAYPTFGMLATLAVVLLLRLLDWLIER